MSNSASSLREKQPSEHGRRSAFDVEKCAIIMEEVRWKELKSEEDKHFWDFEIIILKEFSQLSILIIFL